MKKVLFFLAVLLSGSPIGAQEASENNRVGNIFIIKAPAGSSFSHLDFPRKNFIIKRGGIANYKSVYGNRVSIVASEQLEDGNTQVSLKRIDGRKFFNFLPLVKANLEQALKVGELVPYNPKAIETKNY